MGGVKLRIQNVGMANWGRRVEEREESVGVLGWERGEQATTNGERGVARSSNIRAVRFIGFPSPALFNKVCFPAFENQIFKWRLLESEPQKNSLIRII